MEKSRSDERQQKVSRHRIRVYLDRESDVNMLCIPLHYSADALWVHLQTPLRFNGIHVVHLSLLSSPRSHYSDDSSDNETECLA